MKFQFCGSVNCPEWFISEISVLTKITAVKTKLIFSQLVLNYLQNADITAKVIKLLNGTGLDNYQIHAVIATLKFILENAVTFNVDQGILNKELIDLGLPKQNVESINKTFKSNRQKLLAKANQDVLKTTGKVEIQYTIHEFLGSSKIGTISNDQQGKPIFAEIKLQKEDLINKKEITHKFIATTEDIDYLIYQAQSAIQTLQKIQKEKARRKEEIEM